MATSEDSTVSRAEKRVGGWLGGFREFILRGNVVDLAVGIMIGIAFSGVVNALVSDIFTPLIPTGSKGLDKLSYPISYTGSQLQVGAFINAVISFLILAFVIYFFIVRPVNTLMERYKPKQPEAVTTRECPFCLSSVPIKASRCAFCTSELPPVERTAPAAQTG